MLSCKKEGGTQNAGSIYPEQAVGMDNNGKYTIADEKALATAWEAKVEGKAKLTAFEIVKGTTEGDVAEDFYMLVARTEDGTAKVASLLELRGNKFYFGSEDHKGSESYLLVICRGECDGGCLPAVRKKDGVKHLICSSCADCEKNEIETH
ncbi:hypothetical protein HYN59_07565 [Flavobacterium album]|uniref:Uncharacterized protein n=2 Tax=Flavobacterium album TaxID=2175091 RepID=A0A2S1QX49_9FLAO|nr:hypothetical protein HYN59_07565 [Flavobacterium album]